MARRDNILSNEDIITVDKAVIISSYSDKEEKVVVEEKVYEGPTLEEIVANLEAKRETFDDDLSEEKLHQIQLIQDMRDQSEAWITAFKKEKEDHIDSIIGAAKQEADRIIQEATSEADTIIFQYQDEAVEARQKAYREGTSKGRIKGFESKEEEVIRLLERLIIVLDSIVRKRNDILNDHLSYIQGIVVMIIEKAIKSLPDENKSLLFEYTEKFIKTLTSNSKVEIQTNISELKLTKEHENFFKMQVESVPGIELSNNDHLLMEQVVVDSRFREMVSLIEPAMVELIEKLLEEIKLFEERDPLFRSEA